MLCDPQPVDDFLLAVGFGAALHAHAPAIDKRVPAKLLLQRMVDDDRLLVELCEIQLKRIPSVTRHRRDTRFIRGR